MGFKLQGIKFPLQGDYKCIENFIKENLEWKDYLEYLRTLVRIILKWNLKKFYTRVGTMFIWLGIKNASGKQ
jgi:hypothetical protein